MHFVEKITYRLSPDILLISYAVIVDHRGTAMMLLPKYA
jgi:hypothetical protein